MVKASDGIQRVRIGLTGLAFVFVLVLLAAVFTNPSDERPITPNSIAQQANGAENPASAASAQDDPKEPLAELGVAPGNADSNSSKGNTAAK